MIKKTMISTVMTLTLLVSASSSLAVEGGNNSQWVDPFIGTGGDGHLFPGAVTPFGMVQLSPDTDEVFRGIDPQAEIYKRCAGMLMLKR